VALAVGGGVWPMID